MEQSCGWRAVLFQYSGSTSHFFTYPSHLFWPRSARDLDAWQEPAARHAKQAFPTALQPR
eukprot:2075548-Pyramimonas_sp.AAC.1